MFAVVLLGCGAAPVPPNILLITLDTTRADRLGCYGHERPTSPNLDALAAESVVYTRAISTSSWTLPAHASLFTGKFTASHGAQYHPMGNLKLLDGIEGPAGFGKYRARGVAKDEVTLASLLAGSGYVTAAVVAGPWMKRVFGLDRGFLHYDDAEIDNVKGRSAEQVTEAAVSWLEGNRNRPFLLFLNYYDPHFPLSPPPEFARRFGAELTAGSNVNLYDWYDAEIAYMDHHIGRLLDRLREWKIFDDALIIVTADHGELLGEHGGLTGHGKFLFQEEIHIPMLIKHPGGSVAPARTDRRIQLVDILPLILEYLGLPVPPGIQGQTPGEVTHPIVAETYPLGFASPHGAWRTLIEDDYKLSWNGKGRHLLVDLASDPGEGRNLILQERGRAAEMMARLNRYLDSLPSASRTAEEVEVDPQTKEALRSLGYTN